MSDHVTRPLRAVAAGFATVAVGGVGLFVALASPASAHEGTEPVPVPEGNPDCIDLAELIGTDGEWDEYKIEPFPDENGEYEYVLSDRGTPDDDSDDAVFTLEVFDTKRFNWSSTVGIDAIFVKGGAGAGGSYYYYFDGEELTEDVDYTVPPWGEWTKNDISHITICWDDENPGTTTTSSSSTTSSTTSTTAPSSTSSSSSAPPTSDTTATTAPSSTVTTAPTTTTTTGEELPNTGSNSTMMLVGIGTALLAAGAGLVFATRRYWHRTA